MAPIRVEVLLLSGRGVAVTAAEGVTVGDLKTVAQKRLAVGIAKLIHHDQILADATTLAEAALKDGDVLVASLRAPAILGCRQCPAFFLVRGDGRVAVWGDVSLGVPRQLRNPQQVVGGRRALAALVDGRVITWGHGQFQPPAELLGQLEEVCQLCATEDAFAALRRDGQVLCWGEGAACDGSWVYQLLGEVLMLAASSSSFLAIAQDGLSAVTWGGRRDRAQLPQLHCRAQQVVATSHSFAVLQEDGQVLCWGRTCRPNLFLVLEEVSELCASEDAFGALRKDGTVVTWRPPKTTLEPVEGLSHVTQLVASRHAFAALKRDGTVAAWGHPRFGGDAARLRHVQRLHASSGAFAALRADGSVRTWGDARCGGDATALKGQLADVRRLCRFKQRFFETEE